MKYDAFISYRHSELDMFVAKKVHKYLETYRVPGKVKRATGKKRISRVFRDQEELPIGSDLGDNIGLAIRESEFLLVVCSPRILQSEWCMKEIDTFISTHDRQHVLAILVEGEPNESFPPQLLVDENGNPVEPLAADVRGANNKEVEKKIKTEGLRLCAAILGCDYDDLKQRHRERVLKRYTLIAGVIAALALAFGIYNAYNLQLINENYQEKLENESKTLAATSLDVLDDGDRKTAALIALEGLPVDEDRPLVPEAEYALAKALNTYSIGSEISHDEVLEHRLNVSDFYVCTDAEHVVSYDYSNMLYFWDVASGETIFTIDPQYDEGKNVQILNVIETDDTVIAARELSWTKYDENGNELLSVDFDGVTCYAADFSQDGKLIACNFLDSVDVYDTTNGEKLISYINEDEDDRYSGDFVFDQSGEYMAVSHCTSLSDTFQLTIFDLKDQTQKDVAFDGNLLFDMAFTVDGDLLFSDAYSDDFFINETTVMNVEKVDPATGEKLWVSQVDYVPLTSADMTYPQVGSRIYTDSEGLEHGEAFASTGSCLYTLDLENGDLITNIQDPRGLENYTYSSQNSLGFIGSWDGTVDICDFTTGDVYSDDQIEVADTILSFDIKNSMLFARSYLSNEITVMSYQTGLGIDEMPAVTEGINSAKLSPDHSNFFVCGKDENLINTCYVYDSTNLEQIGVITASQISYEEPFYVDDSHIAFLYKGGTVGVVDISTGEEEVISLLEGGSEFAVSKNGQGNCDYVANLMGQKFAVASLQNGEDFDEFEIENNVDEFLITSDEKYIFYQDFNRNLYRLDLSTGTEEAFGPANSINAFSASGDGSLIALACNDGVLRVMECQTGDTVCEADFFSTTSSNLIQFSPDDTLIYLQGGDKYFKILSIADSQYVYTYPDQLTTIEQVDYYPEKNILTVRLWYDLYLIDCNNYGFLADAEFGLMYLDKGDKIVSGSHSGTKLYSFPYQDYEDLITEAHRQFGEDAELSEEQKLKYNIGD